MLKLKEKALRLGANDARIISIDTIPIEDEIIEMCRAPLCEVYGKSANCPPHVMRPREARKWIKGFRAALLFKIDVAPPVLLSKERFETFRKIYMIASGREVFSIGQGFAISKVLAAGSCKHVFCKDLPCETLTDGAECRYPALARPSMEALGINVFKLVREVGWEIHPILRESDPEAIQSAMLAGLVLVS